MSGIAEAKISRESEEISDNVLAPEAKPQKTRNISTGAQKLRTWLNKSLRIQMFDGRVLVGIFLCTDRDANVILGSCTEYLPAENTDESNIEEPRMLGLVMVPGKHIQSVSIDVNQFNGAAADLYAPLLLSKDVSTEQ